MKPLLLVWLMAISSGVGHARQIVDVHSHNIFPFYREVIERHGAEMEEGFPLPAWEVDSHRAFMDSAGIGCTILSMPAPQPWFGDRDECRRGVRQYNDSCARLKAASPERFRFCASLPLPDVDAAIAEAVYALDTLGADGVKLATNSRGQYLGDEALDPLMEVLNRRKAVIVVHPHKPVPVNERLMARLPLAAYEYPAETTRALMNMLTRNLLVRYPDVKVVVPHGGSFLPLAIPRLKALVPVLQARGLAGDVDIEANLSRLYYDLAGVTSPAVIRTLLTITAPDHIMYGSDYPYQSAELLTRNLHRLESALAADKELSAYADDFLWRNAARLFSLPVDSQSVACPASQPPTAVPGTDSGMLVRISEIEIYPQYFDAYLAAALEVGATSVREEPGVIAIYPMIQQRDSCQVRILEIYASGEAYRHHLTTPHFKTYKQGTLHMVKSLDLVDMIPMNPSAMPEIFLKMKPEK